MLAVAGSVWLVAVALTLAAFFSVMIEQDWPWL